MANNYHKGLKRNISIFYINSALSGLLFTVPVWVAFHLRYLTYTQMAFIAALSYGVTLVLELPTGALADLIGRKRTVIIGQTMIGIFRIYLGFAITPLMFYIGWLGEAAGNALVSGSDTALLYDSLKEQNKEKSFPKIIAKSSLTRRTLLVVAVLSGGYFYKIFVGLPFILRGTAYMFMALASLLFIEPKIDTYTFNLKNYILQTKEGVRHLLRTSYLKTLALYYMVVVGIIWVLQDYFVNTFAKDSGYTETEQSWAFATFYLISTLIILFITRNEDKMPNKKVVFLTVPVLLVFALIPGYFASKLLVFFLILTVNITSAIKGALLDNYVNEEIDSKYRATAMSALNLAVSGIYMATLIVSGPIQEMFSNRLVWSLIGVLAFIVLTPITRRLLRNKL